MKSGGVPDQFIGPESISDVTDCFGTRPVANGELRTANDQRRTTTNDDEQLTTAP